MKRIIIILYITLVLSLIGLFIYGNSKAINYKYYTIKENISLVYEKNRRMVFNIYSEANRPMIIYPEYNSYTLRLDTVSFTLENVKVNVYDGFDINLIKIESDMPELTDKEINSKKCILEIINGSGTINLNLGTFSLLNSNYYDKLTLDSLSGSYSSYNNYFNLVGINLTLNKKYNYMSDFRIGGFVRGILSKTKGNTSYDNEINILDIMPNYNPTKLDNDSYVLGIKNKMMFIPIGYNTNYLTRSGYIVAKLDDKFYYFDSFPYMTTDPQFNKYKDYLVEGEIYA